MLSKAKIWIRSYPLVNTPVHIADKLAKQLHSDLNKKSGDTSPWTQGLCSVIRMTRGEKIRILKKKNG